MRLYSNQSPPQLTLVRGGKSGLVKAGGPTLRVTGPWRIQLPGQDPLALSNPLEYGARARGLTLTITVPLEEYVAGVLAGESAGFRSAQSLAAMAVAVRTYAVRFQGRHKPEGYDFCDTTHCQDLASAPSPRDCGKRPRRPKANCYGSRARRLPLTMERTAAELRKRPRWSGRI